MLKRTHIMIHHSFTKDSPSISWGAIERYHVETRGWKDIAYHFGVEQLGDRDYYAVVGRPMWKEAAACYQEGMNRKAIHICCVGNYDVQPPPPGLLHVLVKRVILPVMCEFEISSENIVGHRDFATYKSCPGTQFDLSALKAAVKKELL